MLKKINKGLRIAFALISISALSVAQAKSVSLSHVSFSSESQQSVFTLNLSEKTPYHAFVLNHPHRLVLDMDRTHLSTSIRSTRYADSPVSRIRWSEDARRLRMVFDIPESIKVRVRTLDFAAAGKPAIRINFIQKGASSSEAPLDAKTSIAPPKALISSDSRQEYRRKVVVVIDPGHGGKDPGAIGRDGTREKNVVLAISRKLYQLINSEPGFTAKLTRTGDYYITLRQRLAIARQYHADMFIAIHADKWKNTTAKGASIFALSTRGATGEAARWLASRENKSELMGGATLSDKNQTLKSVLINLSQTAAITSSLQIGDALMDALKLITPLHVHHIEQAAFVVLKSPDIPSLLVETGFLSNPREEQQLQSSAYQMRMAAAINRGLIHYYREHPPRDTLLASKQ